MKETSEAYGFQQIVMALLFIVLMGHVLVIGKGLLLPIIIAIISVYILVSTSEWLARQLIVGNLPMWAHKAVVLIAFIAGFLALFEVIISTSEEIVAQLPAYEENIISMMNGIALSLGVEQLPDWAGVWQKIMSQVKFQTIAATALGSLSAMAGTVFMVVIYAMFLLGERGGFAHKIATALPGEGAEQTQQLVQDINKSIGDYLAVKTLVNIILAAISYVILLVMGVDFALFWAILIGLLNYIPYVGSLLGVMLPVLLTMAQFGSLQVTVITAALLFGAQTWVGNVLEPRMVGKSVNMSPFVVLVALTLWSSLWGVAGAILAIPLTAVIIIIMANFSSTRPFSVLLADDVDQYTTTPQDG